MPWKPSGNYNDEAEVANPARLVGERMFNRLVDKLLCLVNCEDAEFLKSLCVGSTRKVTSTQTSQTPFV